MLSQKGRCMYKEMPVFIPLSRKLTLTDSFQDSTLKVVSSIGNCRVTGITRTSYVILSN
ncbi:hypothetical protein JCM19294_2101 [Nonlabens tegetincola]|uniref:Uncharacterized protein n=1 Tax=Nonlabens tegetincola TaxID=323273 RepID=A0A090Q4B8_9FLAO|nr:hypothetical protein JCM19294_2101 [Nonlabens tegetincola]